LYSSNVVLGSSRVYIQAYTCLQHIVQEHIANSTALLLLKSPKLISKYESVKIQGKALLNILQNNAEFVQMQDNQDYIQNIKRLLVTKQENLNLFKDFKYINILNS
jgi:hypothetical protein